MRQVLVDRIAPPVYGAIDFLVIVMPAAAIKLASDAGGMRDAGGLDLLVASSVIGIVHADIASSRLRAEERDAVRGLDVFIAAADALVVLALGATLLPIAVLWGFADEHASIADRGYPVVALWAGLQLVAVALAEATGRFVFWWLEPHPRESFTIRRRRRHPGGDPPMDLGSPRGVPGVEGERAG
jgi:hypothetical protein